MKAADKEKLSNFIKKISDMNCMAPVWEKVLDVLTDLEPDAGFEALALFCIYFSQLDDGNICIPLDQKKLTDKWLEK